MSQRPRLPPPPSYEDTLAIEKIPGKDYGIIAKRALRRGEIFFCERPIVRVTHGKGPSEQHQIKWIGEDETLAKWKLLTLAKNAAPKNVFQPRFANAASSDLAAVLNTNAFVGEEVEGARHSLTFLTVSRINHSCVPNCELIVSLEPSELGCVKALRDIAMGTELTLDYGASGSRAERQRHLRQCFAFDCTCERCSRELALERQTSRQLQLQQHPRPAAQQARGGSARRHR